MKKILAVSGSTRKQSSNKQLLQILAEMSGDSMMLEIYGGIDKLPHFNPDQSGADVPVEVLDFRAKIRAADGVIICTPEYVFSLPGAMKNALEWTVSSADFYRKPVALITASLSGEKAHEALCLIMKTIEADFDENTALLVSGVRGKLLPDGTMVPALKEELQKLLENFSLRIRSAVAPEKATPV